MKATCPKCDADISDTYERADRSCGIEAGWSCEACNIGIAEWEVERERSDDDVPIISAREFLGDRPIGTPASKISGRPGHPGFDEFCRIARSWGYD